LSPAPTASGLNRPVVHEGAYRHIRGFGVRVIYNPVCHVRSDCNPVMRSRQIAAIGWLFVLGGCAATRVPLPTPTPATASAPAVVAADLPCVQTGYGCIPLNPDVNEDTVMQTICVPGYTQTVRPSSSYTNGIKAKLLRENGIDESMMRYYELDHIVPLALGGHPRKPANLALQPWDGEHGAIRKDLLERRLQIMVCRGELQLTDAQACIAEDWEACDARHPPGFPLHP
jgi:hypothetical protein